MKRIGIVLFSLLATGTLMAADESVAGGSHSAALAATAPAAATGQPKGAEFSETTKGTNKQTLVIGKMDPPAAFNLEDIQNFPEDRLTPVLNNPVTFEEGRDFSSMMENADEKLIHPWLPEIPKGPYLVMKPELDKAAKDWTFSVIDQGGAPVFSQDGKGSPPNLFSWSGEDKKRGSIAVDTVYIPQLATTDKEGYRHTYMGAPVQYAALYINDKGRTIIELSTKRLFLEKKSELSKEAPVFLEKVCDTIREEAKLPFAIKAYGDDSDLANAREKVLSKYFVDKLNIPANQISMVEPADPAKRGEAIAVILNGTPGGKE